MLFTYYAENELGFKCNLLGFGPIEYETYLGWEQLYNYLLFKFSIHSRSWDIFTAVVAINCNVHKSLASMLECGFVGRKSHRFCLAVCDIINEAKTLTEKVNTIMKNSNIWSTLQNF